MPGRKASSSSRISDRQARRIAAYWLIERQGWSPADAAAATGFKSAATAARWAQQVAMTGSAADSGEKRRKPRAAHARAIGDALEQVGFGSHRVAEHFHVQPMSQRHASESDKEGLTRRPWSAQEDAQLLHMRNAGHDIRLIATALGRTTHGVETRWTRLMKRLASHNQA